MNPVQSIISRCEVGFYPWQKFAITVLGAAYVGSPLDLLPDLIPFVGWGDDVYVIYLLIRVWASPTLPAPNGVRAESGATPFQRTAPVAPASAPLLRRENVGGAR